MFTLKYHTIFKYGLLDHIVTWENDSDILISKKGQITEQYCIIPFLSKKKT